METSSCHYSVAGHQIATHFCTCHDSTSVVPCMKFCSDHCIRIEVRVKRNFHRIRIAMEKPLVKRGPASLCVESLPMRHHSRFPWPSSWISEHHDGAMTKTLSTLLDFCGRNPPPLPLHSPHKGLAIWSFPISLLPAWTTCSAKKHWSWRLLETPWLTRYRCNLLGSTENAWPVFDLSSNYKSLIEGYMNLLWTGESSCKCCVEIVFIYIQEMSINVRNANYLQFQYWSVMSWYGTIIFICAWCLISCQL